MAFVYFNVKADQNVSCWVCDHFQRYDKESTPNLCIGECRARAPLGFMESELNGGNAYTSVGFPLVKIPQIWWCGKFERSTEQSIPPAPDPKTCDAELPDVVEDWHPWKKKPISCWTCDHFQRLHLDPNVGDLKTPCSGWCRKNPPIFYASLESIPFNGYSLLNHWGTSFGALYWCGDWERARHTVPPVPKFGGEECWIEYQLLKEDEKMGGADLLRPWKSDIESSIAKKSAEVPAKKKDNK